MSKPRKSSGDGNRRRRPHKFAPGSNPRERMSGITGSEIYRVGDAWKDPAQRDAEREQVYKKQDADRRRIHEEIKCPNSRIMCWRLYGVCNTTVAELARYLGKHKKTIGEWIKKFFAEIRARRSDKRDGQERNPEG